MSASAKPMPGHPLPVVVGVGMDIASYRFGVIRVYECRLWQEVNRVLSKHGDDNERQDVKLLKRLKEDLRVLETSWQNKSLHAKKVLRHFLEIVDSISDIARVESIEPAEVVCDDLKEYLACVADGRASLGERSWMTALELIDLVSDSLDNGSAASDSLEKLITRWKEETAPMVSPAKEPPKAPGLQASPSWETFSNAKMLGREEDDMSEIRETDAQELLQKAQEALSSGDGEGAKELALKAAEIIAKAETEERQKREKGLRDALEKTTREESEVEQSLNHTMEAIGEREEGLNLLTERLSQAQSALDEREAACKEIRGEIDEIETEMASIKEKHKKLLDRLQEVLPARDAAERECAKIKAEYGNMPDETENLRDKKQELEHQLELIRKQKAETEAELVKLSEEITV